MHKLIILTGPSCIGKSPMDRALEKFYPDLRRTLQKLILYNDRTPRTGERDGVDYHFRTTVQLNNFKSDPDYMVMDVRGDLQALDLNCLSGLLQEGNAFFEGNPYVASALQTHPKLASYPMLSVFLSPLSMQEIVFLKDPARNVNLPGMFTEIMRRKQLRRKTRQKIELSMHDLEDIEKRASSVYHELQMAWQFDYVIPNHDGEDSDNWEAFYYPVGDARKTMLAFVELLQGKVPDIVEKWEKSLLG